MSLVLDFVKAISSFVKVFILLSNVEFIHNARITLVFYILQTDLLFVCFLAKNRKSILKYSRFSANFILIANFLRLTIQIVVILLM